MRDVPLKPEGTAPPGNPVLSYFENLHLGEGVRAQINVGTFLTRKIACSTLFTQIIAGSVLVWGKCCWDKKSRGRSSGLRSQGYLAGEKPPPRRTLP